ncbi:hypothetical protein QTO17_16975 [Vibrio owensii]
MIKQPPYKVEFGQSEEVPPAHVVAIDNTSIKLSNSSRNGDTSGRIDELDLNVGFNQRKPNR